MKKFLCLLVLSLVLSNVYSQYQMEDWLEVLSQVDCPVNPETLSAMMRFLRDYSGYLYPDTQEFYLAPWYLSQHVIDDMKELGLFRGLTGIDRWPATMNEARYVAAFLSAYTDAFQQEFPEFTRSEVSILAVYAYIIPYDNPRAHLWYQKFEEYLLEAVR